MQKRATASSEIKPGSLSFATDDARGWINTYGLAHGWKSRKRGEHSVWSRRSKAN